MGLESIKPLQDLPNLKSIGITGKTRPKDYEDDIFKGKINVRKGWRIPYLKVIQKLYKEL